jgi:hypothetical protein
MVDRVDMLALEAAINRCREDQPPRDYVLSPALALLAEVYAGLIWTHGTAVDLEALPGPQRQALAQWGLIVAVVQGGVGGEVGSS